MQQTQAEVEVETETEKKERLVSETHYFMH